MPDLNFQIESAATLDFAAVPTLTFTLSVTNASAETIHSVALRSQIQLEVTRRSYSSAEKRSLVDLFGEPGRWGQTLRPLLWTHVQTTIPSFQERISVELQVPCSFDFNVAATKYFYGLTDGEIPLCMMFSGTVYQTDANGTLQVSPISWDKEARFRLPVSIWRNMIDSYYPNTAWMCLRRDTFERLYQFKVDNGIPTWEKAFDELLAAVAKETPA